MCSTYLLSIYRHVCTSIHILVTLAVYSPYINMYTCLCTRHIYICTHIYPRTCDSRCILAIFGYLYISMYSPCIDMSDKAPTNMICRRAPLVRP